MNRTALAMILAAVGCGGTSEQSAEPVDVAPIEPTGGDDVVADTTTTAEPEQADTGPMSIEAPPDVSEAPSHADVTDSGLASVVLRAGSGTTHPTATDRVTVHYVGWTTDGQRFDSSIERGEPSSFPLNGVIAGWTEGVQLMVEGERRRFWIPADLAYGNNPRPGAPQGMLVFDVELIEIAD